jgi:hypothetical protein
MTPALRAWMIQQKDEQASGFYKSRKKDSTPFYFWCLLLLGFAFCLFLFGHDKTPGKSADEVVIQWGDDGFSRYEFIMRECKNQNQVLKKMGAYR